MFNKESNATFNNSLFSCPKIEGMHETAKRLYEAAKTLRNIEGQSAVARLLNASPQVLKNWEARGVSKLGMLTAQRLIGCSATWLETGVGDMVVDGLLPSSDTHNALAGAQSHSNIEVGPDVRGRIPLISWVQAGMWSEAVDIYEPGYAERWLPFLKNNGESTFALQGDWKVGGRLMSLTKLILAVAAIGFAASFFSSSKNGGGKSATEPKQEKSEKESLLDFSLPILTKNYAIVCPADILFDHRAGGGMEAANKAALTIFGRSEAVKSAGCEEWKAGIQLYINNPKPKSAWQMASAYPNSSADLLVLKSHLTNDR